MTRLLERLTSRRGVVVVLAAVWFAVLASNTLFLLADGERPRGMDCAEHVNMTYQIVTGARLGGASAVWQDVAAFDVKWPALVHLINGVAALTVDQSMRALRLYNMLFVAVMLVGVFWIGQSCHSRAAGLLAAVCCVLTPNIIGHARQYGLDFPAAAMVTITMAALLATRGFSRGRPSALFGVLGGLAVMTKGQSLFFFGPAAVGVLALALWRRQRNALPLAGLALLLGLAASTPWWAARVDLLLHIFLTHTDASNLSPEGDQTVLGGVQMYLRDFPLLVSMPLFLGLALLGPLATRRSALSVRIPLALWLVVPLALHVVLAVRNYRYLLALIPAVAVVVAVGVMSFRAAQARRTAAALLCGAAVLGWLLCTSQPLRHQAWACSPLLCGDTDLNQIADNRPLVTAARRLAPVLAREQRAGREVFLMAALNPKEGRSSADLGDIANHLRSRMQGIIWVFQDSTQPAWRMTPRGPYTLFLLAAGERLPSGYKGERVLTVSTRMRVKHRPCVMKKLIPPANTAVSLWKLASDAPKISFPRPQ